MNPLKAAVFYTHTHTHTHTHTSSSLKACFRNAKTIFPIIFLFSIFPAFGTTITDSATCNSATLNSATGPTRLKASYTPNVLTLTYDDNGATTPHSGGANTCTYDTTFNLPTAPTKTGYTFNGWNVKICDFTDMNPNLMGADYTSKSSDGSYCYYYSQTGETNADCSSSSFTGISNGEWMTTFDYGTIKGSAKCSITQGTTNKPGYPTNENGQYCWCRISNYTSNQNKQCSAVSQNWVYFNTLNDSSRCLRECAKYCGSNARNGAGFRRGLFGL